jgi:hypothetical protein
LTELLSSPASCKMGDSRIAEVPSEFSTQPSTASPSRKSSLSRFSFDSPDELSLSASSSSCGSCLSARSLRHAATTAFDPDSDPISPKTPRRLRERVLASRTEALRRNLVSPWHGLQSEGSKKRCKELSLPCVEVGYWSVLDLGRTQGQLSNRSQEEARRSTREVLKHCSSK